MTAPTDLEPKTASWWFVAMAAIVVLPSLAFGQGNAGLIHKAEGGESYAALAERFYGRRFLELHLRQMNRHAEPLKAGTPVIIPTLRRVPVTEKQDLRDFAAVHLQDPDRASYLKVLNRLKDGALAVGDALLVGESLRHVVRPGETFKSIARTYYRSVSKRRLRLLRLYNKMPRGEVRPKMALRIPLDSSVFLARRVKARAASAARAGETAPRSMSAVAAAAAIAEVSSNAAPVSASAKTKNARRRATRRTAAKKSEAKKLRRTATAQPRPTEGAPAGQPEIVAPRRTASAAILAAAAATAPPTEPPIEDALEAAERYLAEGEFASGLRTAVDALARHGSRPMEPRIELLRLKAIAQIALDRPAEAKATFEALLKLDPSYRLDLYSTSPKVLDVFQSIDERSD